MKLRFPVLLGCAALALACGGWGEPPPAAPEVSVGLGDAMREAGQPEQVAPPPSAPRLLPPKAPNGPTRPPVPAPPRGPATAVVAPAPVDAASADAKIVLGKPQITGSIQVADADRALARSVSDLRGCYRAGLVERAELKGVAMFELVIEPDGAVSTVRVHSSALKHEPTELCASDALQRPRFAPSPGAPARVVIPVTFKRG